MPFAFSDTGKYGLACEHHTLDPRKLLGAHNMLHMS